MTPRRRDLGTRGRVIVAAAAVGVVGGLGGWMAATDHSVVTTSTNSSADASASASNSSGASTSAGASTNYDDDTGTATPGLPTQPLTPSDARTGGS
jgi:cytoskeletal protein RodZ